MESEWIWLSASQNCDMIAARAIMLLMAVAVFAIVFVALGFIMRPKDNEGGGADEGGGGNPYAPPKSDLE